jgi:hypothetical protein
MDTYEAIKIIDGDDGESTAVEWLAAWQHIIDTGDAWQLQGFYGRTALELIAVGLVEPGRG